MRKLNWKKIVAGTLSAVMLLSVTACGSSSTKSESASTEAGKKELMFRVVAGIIFMTVVRYPYWLYIGLLDK